MANNEDKLSRLYREGLENFAKDPPPQVWTGIKQGLLFRNIVTLKFLTSLNIYSVSVFVAAAALSGFFAGKQIQQNNQLQVSDKPLTTVELPKNEKIIEPHEIKTGQVNNPVSGSTETLKNSNNEPNIQNNNTLNQKKETKNNQEQTITYPTTKEQAIQDSKNTRSSENNSYEIPGKEHPENDVKKKSPEKEVDQIDVDSQNIKLKEKADQDEQISPPAKPAILPKNPKTRQGLYAEVFIAPSLVQYIFEESDINTNLTFVATSEEDESPALSYTAGLELGYGLKHLFAQTGINYSDYRSKAVMDYITTNSFWNESYVKDSVFVPDSIPHYDYFYDTLRVLNSKDTHENHNSSNAMRYLEIPVMIGYRFYKNKFSYAFAAGASFGYLISSGGTTMNPDMKSISSNDKKTIPYKPWTINLLFRAEGAYLLKNNLSVYIRPGYKYNIGSVFEDHYPVQKSLYTLDLHAGLRYNF